MEYEIQFSRIVTAEKLSDRFLNCQAKNSPDLNRAFMGKVFTLVEITSPWFPTAQVGQTIISTFSQNYYRGSSTSDLVNFEDSLKKVNEILAQVTQNGETDWIGNLNAILAVVVENKLHIAQTGKAEVFIFRDGKVNHVTYGLAQAQLEPHPLKTFSNITSGELKSNDKILMANPELFRHLNLETLQQIISMNSTNDAILHITKLLKKKKVKNVNVLLLHLATVEEISAQRDSGAPDTIHLDKPLESFSAWTSRLWQHVLYPILRFIGRTSKEAGGKSLALTKKYLSEIKNKRDQETTLQPIKKRDLFEKEFVDEASGAEDSLLKDEEIKYSPELSVHYYEQEQQEKKRVSKWWYRALIVTENTFKKIIGGIYRFVVEKYANRRTRPYFLIALAVVVLLILVWIIVGRHADGGNKVNLLEAQTSLREAEQIQKQAKDALNSRDSEKAKNLFAQSIEKALAASSNSLVKSDALKLIESSYTELDQLTATTRIKNLEPVISLNQEAKSFFVVGSEVYFVTKNEIFKSVMITNRPQKVVSLPRNGDFSFGALVDKSIYLYTTTQKVYEFKTETEKIDLVENSSGFKTANASASYFGNWYLLDGVLGQIYKYVSTDGVFGSAEEYIKSASIDVKGGTSLAIDGNLYILRSSGEVVKLQLGKLQDFSLRNIPSPWSKIEKPLKIETDADMSSIYILDGGKKRILEFDKNGYYLRQIALPEKLDKLSDFIVSDKLKKIWVLNGQELYEISI